MKTPMADEPRAVFAADVHAAAGLLKCGDLLERDVQAVRRVDQDLL